MNPYQTLYNKPVDVVILDVAIMLEDLQSELADFAEFDHLYYTHREIFHNAWRFMQSDMHTGRISEALMVDLSMMCSMRLQESVKRVDSAIRLFTQRLIHYCIDIRLYDDCYGMMYDFGGWVDSFTPFAVPLGAKLDLSQPTRFIRATPPYQSELDMLGPLKEERFHLPF